MKRTFKIISVISLVSILILSVFASYTTMAAANAKQGTQTALLLPFSFSLEGRGSYFRTETSVPALIDSLKSSWLRSRTSAAYRLAELGNISAVPELIKAYEAEPITRQRDIDAGQGFKYYSLVAIGVLGGPAAEKYLCDLAEELIFNKKGSSNYGDDALDIGIGLMDGLSMTKSACAEDILSRIIQQNEKVGRPNATLAFAYTAKERLSVVRDMSSTAKRELIDGYRILEDSIQQKQGQLSLHENERRTALRINLREIGIADPSVLRDYKSGLSTGDPFISKLDEIINSADNWRVRLGK